MSQLGVLALLTFCLSSCYYSSPIPLATEGKGLEAGICGKWEMQGEKPEERYVVNLYSQEDKEGYNGDVTISGYNDKNELETDFHKLRVFVTNINGVGVINIGINAYEDDGEYFFGKYLWDKERLSLFYVNEKPFKNSEGNTQKFQDIEAFKQRFIELMNHPEFFENEEPMVFHKID